MAEMFPPPHIDLGMPDWGFSQSPDANVEITSLGDGYEFRSPKGLNYIRESMSPTWSNLSPSVGRAAYDWLRPKLKLESVLWHHPVSGKIYKVIPESIGIQDDTFDNVVLTVTWREDFNPG